MAFNYPIGSLGAPKMASKHAPAKNILDAADMEHDGEMEPHHEAIHEHLHQMHEQTGEAHSHVEHHDDGTHTSHHVDKEGEVTGPHSHANLEALKDHMDNFLNEEEHEGDGEEHEAAY